eukprot:3870136-Karenia_brevis.AAC.1
MPPSLRIPLPAPPPTPLINLDLQDSATPQHLINHIFELNKTITDQQLTLQQLTYNTYNLYHITTQQHEHITNNNFSTRQLFNQL